MPESVEEPELKALMSEAEGIAAELNIQIIGGHEKDGISNHDFVLCFGKQQADGSYLADRIIMIVFN